MSELFNPENCQKDDSILVYNSEEEKHHLGKIQEFKLDHGTFYYQTYIPTNQLGKNHQNELDQYGQDELFLSDELKKEKIENIKEKIIVLDFLSYIQNQNTQTNQRQYVQRGQYDISAKQISTQLDIEYECFCGKIVNPDHTLIVCNKCNKKAVHYNCLTNDTVCQCGNKLKKDDYQSQLKLKRQRESMPSLEEIPPMKKLQTQNSFITDDGDNKEMEEEQDEEDNLVTMQKAQKKQIDGSKIKNLFEKLKQQKEESKQQQSSSTQNQKPQPLKKSNSTTNNKTAGTNKIGQQNSGNQKKLFSNITPEQVKEMNQIVERYRQTSLTSRLKDMAKKRQEVKERIVKLIVYGYFEIKNSNEINPSDIRVLQSTGLNLEQADAQLKGFKEEFEKIKNYNSQQMFDESRKLAIQIETNLYKLKNSNNMFNLTQEYKDRFRIINTHLIDDQNSILRLKILLKSMQISDLIKTDEVNLYNPQKRMEIEKLKQKENQITQVKQSYTIIKTNKADIEVLEQNNQKEDDYDKLKKYEEEQEQIRIQNEKRRQELLIKGTPFEYRDFLSVNDKKDFLQKLKDSLENVNQSQIDHDLFQNILNLTGGNGKKRMNNRIQKDLKEEDQYKFLPTLDQF